MQDYPHFYKVAAKATSTGDVQLASAGLPTIVSSSPPEFGGTKGNWSPETLLVASIADCFNLTFRAIARASKFEWLELDCKAEGRLEKFNRVTRFTSFDLHVVLKVPDGTMKAKALRLMELAENNCLITNSLAADVHLDAVVEKVPTRQVA